MSVAPIVQTYATTTPYITLAEFINTPTALEVTDLIPQGTQAQQNAAMIDAIRRASSWADRIAGQILATTLDFQRGRFRIDRDGKVTVPLRFKPVLEIKTVNYGLLPSQMVALQSFVDVAIMQHGTVEIPLLGNTIPAGFTGGLAVNDRPIVDVGYVNGWPNALTTQAEIVGATSIPVNTALGVYAGSVLTIHDGASTEDVTVSSVSGNTLTIAAPGLAFAHAVGVSISNMPTRVKAATVLLTCALIQTRGNDAIILDALETPQRTSGEAGAATSNVQDAKALLGGLERVW